MLKNADHSLKDNSEKKQHILNYKGKKKKVNKLEGKRITSPGVLLFATARTDLRLDYKRYLNGRQKIPLDYLKILLKFSNLF